MCFASASDAEIHGGFASGAPLDALPPDEMLAGFAARAYDRGLGLNALARYSVASREAADKLGSWKTPIEAAN